MLQTFIDNNSQLISATNRLLIAVSGGIDSIVLSHLYSRMFANNLDRLSIVHCNFHLRDEDSNLDAAFVQQWAQTLGIKCVVKDFDVTGFRNQHKQTSIQMAARELRYNYFNELMTAENYDYTALAHHSDDQIETFFINLLRAGGYKGLRGMLPKRGKYIRPLLNVNRQDIEKYADENNLQYHEDRTNAEDKYLRNNIRHKLIPMLEQISPVAKKNILTTMDNLRDVENGLAANFEYLQQFNFTPAHIRQILKTKRNGAVFYSATHRLQINKGEYVINEIKEHETIDEYVFNNIKEVTKKNPLQIDIIKNEDINFKVRENIAFFDFDKLQFPLTIRKAKVGDVFIPFGMTGKKRISRLFIDLKLSREEREAQWLLCDKENILWVIGRRACNACVCDSTTVTVVRAVTTISLP